MHNNQLCKWTMTYISRFSNHLPRSQLWTRRTKRDRGSVAINWKKDFIFHLSVVNSHTMYIYSLFINRQGYSVRVAVNWKKVLFWSLLYNSGHTSSVFLLRPFCALRAVGRKTRLWNYWSGKSTLTSSPFPRPQVNLNLFFD